MKQLKNGAIIVMSILFFGANICQAATIIQHDAPPIEPKLMNAKIMVFYPIADSNIVQHFPDNTPGTLDYMTIVNEDGGGGTGWARDALVRYDISSIPPGRSILSATFRLYYYDWGDSNPAGRPLSCYRITSDWDEATVSWNTQPSYTSSPITQTSVPFSTGTWIEWDVTSDVTEFYEGTKDNFGWRIADEKAWGGMNIPRTRTRSKEYGAFTPELVIEVSEPPSYYFTSTADAEITQQNPNNTSGTSEYITIANEDDGNGTGRGRDALIRYNLSSIPPDKILLTATLKLHYYDWINNDPAGRPLRCYRITSDWDENTVTWNTQPSYDSYHTTETPVPANIDTWIEWDVFSDVQGFYEGTHDNFGWRITDETPWAGPDIPQTCIHTKEYGAFLPELIIEYYNAPPDTPSIPTGPTFGITYEEYTYTSMTTDVENDEIYYKFDWGDDTQSEWIGPFASGETISVKHQWLTPGIYGITVKAKDVFDGLTTWSEALTVDIGAPALTITSMSGGFRTVSFAIQNNGNRDAQNTSYAIALNRGIIVSGLFTSGTIDTIPAGGHTMITSKPILGFGFVTIAVDINLLPYQTLSHAHNVFIFLSLIIG
jgi:hypothetical protein